MEPATLEVRDLSIALDVGGDPVALTERVSFTIGRGEVLALVGESGSGKSVTALALMQLLGASLSISGGEVLLHARDGFTADIARLDPRGREIRAVRGGHMGMVFQEPMSSFSPVHTIGRQIAEVVEVHERVPRAEARARAAALLAKVGIPNPVAALDRYPQEFSGGMRQRAMIARALVCGPSLLIADEPTTALDVTIQAQILSLLRSLQQESGMAILFITHDLGIVAQMADRVAIMYAGRIVETGAVREIFRRPAHPYTRALIEAVPRLGDLEHGRRIRPIAGAMPSLFEPPPGCRFHPRCPVAELPRCAAALPPVAREGGHEVACIHGLGEVPA
ncbi:ABC transporter ATP-binding protein [Amaricoccus sp.]|uniref:ABC transporter ATP-binding protein n=1 Tax=Amaricoccus sp. TaxID=1872485 RepID=UPI001B40BE75|nr:ABC transporter ATP-binding protein [Amaricoccus sp.]MBP7002931.1 ABC transporter ATP-binding protein [Amaricoccus sp.]